MAVGISGGGKVGEMVGDATMERECAAAVSGRGALHDD